MCEPPVRFINDVVGELMDKIAESYAQNKQSKNYFIYSFNKLSCFNERNIWLTVEDDLLTSLHVVFPNHLIPALDLCDHHSVSVLTTPSGRKIYKCIGSSGTPYLIPYTGYICSCPAFKFGQIELDRYCKHLIALMISLATNNIQEISIGEETYFQLITEFIHEE